MKPVGAIATDILTSHMADRLRALQLKCELDPVHVKRDMLTCPTGPSAQEALHALYSVMAPMLSALQGELDIPWVAHVQESSVEGDYEHWVIPSPIYQAFKPSFDSAGFVIAEDKRQFASGDGLREALLNGSDFNKKWV